jgi:hypothetical protein
MTMKKIYFLLFTLNVIFNLAISAQLQVSTHFGLGRPSYNVDNKVQIFEGARYLAPNLVSSPFPTFDLELNYFIKNKIAINIAYNTFEVSHSQRFIIENFQGLNGGSFSSAGSWTASCFSVSLSKNIPLSNNLALIPEIGIGQLNYSGSTSGGGAGGGFGNRDTMFNFTGKRKVTNNSTGYYLPMNIKLQYPIIDFLAANFKVGYQLHFNDYFTKTDIEYSSPNFPNKIGLAEYKYKNLLSFSIGATLQIFDENGKFQNFGSKRSKENANKKRPQRIRE